MRRLSAALSLLAYLGCALVLPELHRRHHERYGADHEHVGDAVVFVDQHAAADADFSSLDLDFVGGAIEVDCSLAEYTLVSCENRAHPPAFGDEILAHRPHKQPDPTHGQGSLLHLAGWLIAPAPVLPPPAPAAYHAPLPAALATLIRSQPTPVPSARGPPAANKV